MPRLCEADGTAVRDMPDAMFDDFVLNGWIAKVGEDAEGERWGITDLGLAELKKRQAILNIINGGGNA